jgi:transcriptional regulator of heat shock response
MSRAMIDPDTQLTPRQKSLLFAVIKEYCDKNESIGSKDLQEKDSFQFSAATIRNEIVRLRDLGYLFQPYTNSGSQPTEKAFKLFINQLILGLQVTNHQQHELRLQLQDMQDKEKRLSKEISRLLAFSGGVGFSVNKDTESISGIGNLLNHPTEGKVGEILELLDNLDQYKGFLLEHKEESQASVLQESKKKAEVKKQDLHTIFSGESSVLPLGQGYAMVASNVMIDGEKSVIGLITPVHLLAQKKNLELVQGISEILRGKDNDQTKNS